MQEVIGNSENISPDNSLQCLQKFIRYDEKCGNCFAVITRHPEQQLQIDCTREKWQPA